MPELLLTMAGEEKGAESSHASSSLVHRPVAPTGEPDVESSEALTNARDPRTTKAQMKHIKKQSKDFKVDTQKVSKPASEVQPLQSKSNDALPDFILRRNKLFDDLKKTYDKELKEREHPEIKVTLNLGVDKDGKPRPLVPIVARAWDSTPGSFLRHVDRNVSADVVLAKVDGKQLWDLDRPLEHDCQVSYLPFTSPEGRNVFWHSSAHVLGEAAECQYNCLLSHGPPVEQGFFYDMAIAQG